MISFFRKIRRNLAFQNKVGRYMRYAFGEIILVVMGILIALQINNWNQRIQKNKESKIIIASIKVDLEKDTVLLKERIAYYNDLLPYNNKLIERFDAPKANLDTIISIAEDFNPLFWKIDSFNNTTFSSIKSSGKIDLLKSPLKKELLEYEILQNSCLNHSNEDIYLNLMYNYLSKYRFGNTKSEYVNKINTQIQNDQEYVNKLTSLVGYKSFMMHNTIEEWKFTLKKAERLLEIIDTMNLNE